MRTDTALENLRAAQARALAPGLLELEAEWHIISVAVSYAEDHPDWFASWPHCMFETEALTDAAQRAAEAGDKVAALALSAAAELAHPESDRHGLFGGAS